MIAEQATARRGQARRARPGTCLGTVFGFTPRAGRDHRLGPTSVPVLKNLNYVDHLELPPWHLGTSLTRGSARGVYASKESGAGASLVPTRD